MIEDKILYAVGADNIYLFDGETLQSAPPKKTKDHFTAACLSSTPLRSHSFKLPEGTSEEKIEIQSEILMYEEGGLDPETDYKIASLAHTLEMDTSLLIESYALEETYLHETFDKISQKLGHIDCITPAFFSYEALYTFERLDPKIDLFLYLDDDEAYMVIFKEGKYIAYRSLPTMNELSEKVNTTIEDIRETLATKGLLDENYGRAEFLRMNQMQEHFSKIAERIAHTISHKRGIFGLDHIDRIFIDFDGGEIPGLLNLFDAYGFEEAQKLTLNPFEQVETQNQHHAIAASYILGVAQGKITPVNLTLFERKPHFLTTHVGRFAAVFVLTVVLAAAYPIYATLHLDELNNEIDTLGQKESVLTAKTAKLTTELKKLKTKQSELKEQESETLERIKTVDLTVDALAQLKNQQNDRQQMMFDVNAAMKKLRLSSSHLEQKGSESLKVHIIAKYDRRDDIAKFMQMLINKGYSNVSTEEIALEKNIYESIIEIQR